MVITHTHYYACVRCLFVHVCTYQNVFKFKYTLLQPMCVCVRLRCKCPCYGEQAHRNQRHREGRLCLFCVFVSVCEQMRLGNVKRFSQ